MAKNSAFERIKRIAALKKTKIKNKTECIGFLHKTTNKEEIIITEETTKNKNIVKI